ncbi:pre-rRNA processing protein-like protein Utp22 [Mollisia scopiformis]|uniref:U3 small nucleolar RNA-associated protein 22 n=1 Tax=Mollisia scopiformis TaxID=149040 RepID=A0A194WRI9_MOLSC|nr:pre-rRNA processing protein-like protein Utp22 [Mollisia scopiformis]KUJ10623.1 pre-rRNA processing protein-like protein Utp22 [Mollisia scopiformis]
MTQLPSKRRKLGHTPSAELTQEDESENVYDAQSAEESADEVAIPQSKQAALRPKHSQAIDDAALYAGGSYKSSLFKLQVDELLAEVQPNYEKRLTGVNEALRKLKTFIEEVEDCDPVSVTEATKSLLKSHKITIPFPDPKPDRNAAYKLMYSRPSNINVVGSYALKTMVKTEGSLSIDMVLVMPSAIFQEKDYLNYRYFYKRAYYLACLAAGLQEKVEDEFVLAFEYLHGNSLQPILVVKPKSDSKKSNKSYDIRIIPAVPSGTFAESKLRPDKNAIRPKDNHSEQSSLLPPTPFYNATLQSDCNIEPYLKLQHAAAKQSTGFKDACILGRVWLGQRGFSSRLSDGGFGQFEWAALTALLMKGGGPKGHSVLSPSYSSYQMFKALLQYLSINDLASKPVCFEIENMLTAKSNLPMAYDGSRGQNLLFKMTAWSYALLRDEARTSLEMLNDATFDQFESTFIIMSSQQLQRYDCSLNISSTPKQVETNSYDHATKERIFAMRMFDVLHEGLMDRVKLVNVQLPSTNSWSLKSSSTPPQEPLLISFVFDPANIDRLVDHGPSAEEKKKAAKFQKFWGEKAELRRFKDGSILESLVWSPGSAHAVFREIVTYLVTCHFGAEFSNSLEFVGEGFEKLLPGGTSSKNFEALKQAFSTLQNQIKDLEGLPLQLRQLSAISPQLRYSSIETPIFTFTQPMIRPADILIQFEGSGRWPDDIVAIQRTKIAFLLKIGALLQEVDGTVVIRVGLENEDHQLQNSAFLDIICGSGAVFRLRIHNDREQTLLERHIKDKSSNHREREDAVSALSMYKKTFLQLPLLNQSISTHCTRFPLLSSTMRLVKMWFNRHMLSRHVSEELIELIVARTFLHPYPWRAPSSTMTGFLRTLSFISRWDWRQKPLVVDFTGTMTTKDVDSVNTRLEAWRKIDPSMNRTVLIAASNHDITGTAFTDSGPSKMVAARMTALARSACKLVKEKGRDLDHRALFASSTADYNFIVHISPKFTGTQPGKNSKPKFKNLEVQGGADIEMIGLQPVEQYLQELEKLYTDSIVFFHGGVGSNVIAGLWNPQKAAPRQFKVNLAYATKPSKHEDGEADEVVIDKAAILAEIARLGGDMVSRIEVQH